jgi:TRAP-type C4-dicarboxylate transport system substrate-binding protein
MGVDMVLTGHVLTGRGLAARPSAVVAAAAIALSLSAAVTERARAADDKPIVMKIALATLDDVLHQFAKNYAAAIERDSGGRIKVEVYPASKLGSIQRQAEGVQFGAIECQVVAPEFLVGIDERFEVLAAPGLVTSMAQGQRLAADPAVQKLMLGLGADKGMHGAALLMSTPSSVVAKAPIRHLADFQGKKIRIFASQFEGVAIKRLGATPKPMTLAEVLPALQDNSLDAAISAVTIFTPMHFEVAAKYVTEIGQPAIFGVVEISKKWYDSLPADLQQILDKDGAAESVAINPQAVVINDNARKAWQQSGGELISLPPDEQSTLLKIVAGVGDEVSSIKPQLSAAYHLVMEAAQRTQ